MKYNIECNNAIYNYWQDGNKSIKDKWNKLKQTLKENSNNILSVKRNVAKKPWITEEIIILMDERRKFKNHSNISNQHNYKKLRNLVQRKRKIAK